MAFKKPMPIVPFRANRFPGGLCIFAGEQKISMTLEPLTDVTPMRHAGTSSLPFFIFGKPERLAFVSLSLLNEGQIAQNCVRN
jgi:hypothetical protein